jgi:hypothetical protein
MPSPVEPLKGTTKYNFYRYHGVPHSVLSLNCYQAELAESSICNKHVSNTFPAMYHGHGIKFFGCGVKSCHCVSYTRHYKPRLVYFYPIFHCRLYCRAVCISKKGNSSICGPKINQSIIYNLSKISEFYHNQEFKLQTLQYYELIICGYLSQAVASLLWSFHN